MSMEYIKRITIKKDGVYLYSKANNDDCPYTVWRCATLSDVLETQGQHALDKEIIGMFRQYAIPKGSHRSLYPYVYATASPEARKRIQRTRQEMDRVFATLGDADKLCLSKWYALGDDERTVAAKAFKKAAALAEDDLNDSLAELAQEYRKSHPPVKPKEDVA